MSVLNSKTVTLSELVEKLKGVTFVSCTLMSPYINSSMEKAQIYRRDELLMVSVNEGLISILIESIQKISVTETIKEGDTVIDFVFITVK